MMKRIFFSGIAIVSGFLLVVFSAFAVSQDQLAGKVEAQTSVASQSALIEASNSAIAQKTSVDEITDLSSEYYLPYPGILPDHVLYPLKMLRDKFRLAWTNSIQEKAELSLLYSDKRIGAAQVLVSGGKSELGIDTAVKAEGYLSQGITYASKIEDQGLWQRLASASAKHYQVLQQLKTQVNPEQLARIESIVDTNKQLHEAILSRLDQPETESPEETQQTEVEIEQLRPAEFGR